MAVPKKVTNYLNKKRAKYEILKHKRVYTAFDLAQTLKKKLGEIAKTLLVKVDKKYVLIVVPGHYRLDVGKVKKFLKTKKAELAPEKLIQKTLGVKPGALTPFGGLHKIEVLLDKALLKTRDAIIGAGSFTESLRMSVKDLHKLESARLGAFGKAAKKAVKSTAKKAKKRVERAVKKTIKPQARKRVAKAVVKR